MIKLMIVDDEYYIRAGIMQSIDWEKHGYQFIGEASNGLEAYEKIQKNRPDILLTDIRMPVMDGLQLLEKIKAAKWSMKIILLTCYADFDYAQKAVNLGADGYILKLSSQPQDILEKINQIRKQMEPEYSFGGFPRFNIEMIREKFPQAQVYFSKLCVCGITDLYDYDVEKKVNDLLAEKLSEQDYQAKVLVLSGTKMGEYLFILKECLEWSLSLLREIWHHIYSELGIVCNVGISKLCLDYCSIEEYVSQADQAQEFTFYYRKNQILQYGEYSILEHWKDFSDHDFYQILLENDRGTIHQFIHRYLTDNCFLKPSAFLEGCVHIILFVMNFLKKQEVLVPEKYLEKGEVLAILEKCANYAEVCEEVLNQVDTLLIFQDNSYSEQRKIISKIQLAIEKNYNMELSLEFFSKNIGISYCYLSTLFKNETGYSFKEYLNFVRIQHAKELLKDFSVTVNVAADRVGYSNQYYFSKVFKKMVGMSPLEYKYQYGDISSPSTEK